LVFASVGKPFVTRLADAYLLENAKTKPRLRKEALIESFRAFFGQSARRVSSGRRFMNQNGLLNGLLVQVVHHCGA
jgi:hypothetical protein